MCKLNIQKPEALKDDNIPSKAAALQEEGY